MKIEFHQEEVLAEQCWHYKKNKKKLLCVLNSPVQDEVHVFTLYL